MPLKANSPYLPVPTSAAKRLAEEYRKQIVIINAWDSAHGLLHTSTYGVSTEEKAWAAQGGEITAKALGAVLQESLVFEDYRLRLAMQLLEALKSLRRAFIPMDKTLADSADSIIAEAESLLLKSE